MRQAVDQGINESVESHLQSAAPQLSLLISALFHWSKSKSEG